MFPPSEGVDRDLITAKALEIIKTDFWDEYRLEIDYISTMFTPKFPIEISGEGGFPVCRGPSKAVIGARRVAVFNNSR